MLRKMLIAFLVMLCTAGFVYSQTLEISGEMKTGLFWEKVEVPGKKTEEVAKIHNSDDAGQNQGRFRMNLHMQKDTIGMKVRFEKTAWQGPEVQWGFAFAYGNFIDEQLRIVVGKLGESPWSAGGPDIWQELDNQIGVRTEIRPNIVPGLNVGFVLNGWQEANYYPEKNTLGDILMETVLGVAYTHELFHARFSYRLDGESDIYNGQSEGMSLMYRLEERVLKNMVDGLSIWANGWWRGIGTEDKDIILFQNWLYAQWAPSDFTAQLRLGYHHGTKLQEMHTRLSFYYNIFPWLSAGIAATFRADFGENSVKDVPYKLWNIEPQVKATFAPNTYVAFVYQFENEPLDPKREKKTQRINLRTVFTF